jgi:hypothetical protein
MNIAVAWRKGIVAGYQSKSPGYMPPIPPYLGHPVNVKDLKKYYYDLGYQEGIKMSK